MGYDLTGLKAKSKTGEYFRNNVWWWYALAEYVLDNVSLPVGEKEYWHSNSGQRVSEESAKKIGYTLLHSIEKKETQRYSRAYARTLRGLPKEECFFCKGSGKRNGECPHCEGKGKIGNSQTHYPFSTQNVREFAKFCLDSGGFEIY